MASTPASATSVISVASAKTSSQVAPVELTTPDAATQNVNPTADLVQVEAPIPEIPVVFIGLCLFIRPISFV